MLPRPDVPKQILGAIRPVRPMRTLSTVWTAGISGIPSNSLAGNIRIAHPFATALLDCRDPAASFGWQLIVMVVVWIARSFCRSWGRSCALARRRKFYDPSNQSFDTMGRHLRNISLSLTNPPPTTDHAPLDLLTLPSLQ